MSAAPKAILSFLFGGQVYAPPYQRRRGETAAAMAAIDRSAFCDATGQNDADFEPWIVSYFKLAVVCMAAWRLAALVVRLPGKFIPRGTGLLIAGLLASIADMIFDRVAKVDMMINARTGQHNRLNIYFPVSRRCPLLRHAPAHPTPSHLPRAVGRRSTTCACPSLRMRPAPSW